MKYYGYFLLGCFASFYWHSLALTADFLWAKFVYYNNASLNHSLSFASKIVYGDCKCKEWCVSEPTCMAYFGFHLDYARVMCHLSSKSIFDAFPFVTSNWFYASKLSTKTHPSYQTNFWLESDGNIYWRTVLEKVDKTEAKNICSFHENSNVPMILTFQELKATSNIEKKVGVYHTDLMKRNGGAYWSNNISYSDTEIANVSLLVYDLSQKCFRYESVTLRDILCTDKHFAVCQMKLPKI